MKKAISPPPVISTNQQIRARANIILPASLGNIHALLRQNSRWLKARKPAITADTTLGICG